MIRDVLLRQRPGLQRGARCDTDHSSSFQRNHKSKSREKEKKGPGTAPAHKPPPAPVGVRRHSVWMHGCHRLCPSLSGRPSGGEWKAGFLLFTGEDEKETKHHPQGACQGPQGSQESSLGSGVPGAGCSIPAWPQPHSGRSGLLHFSVVWQGAEKRFPHG